MSRLRSALAFAVFLVPMISDGQANSRAAGQTDLALWRFVPPDAKALISIDWARIRQSQAGAMIREKWLTSNPMPAIPGMELLDGIDHVLISSPGKNLPGDAGESPILIAIHGHFDAAKVREVFTHFGAKPQSYNSFQVYRPQGKDTKGTAWVLFDADTILYGDAPSIFATLDRNQFGPPPQANGSLLQRAGAMEANYEFWLIMDATEMVSSDQVAALFQGGEWASEAQGFEAGVNLRAGLAADITVRFSSEATAKRVTAQLTRVINLAAKDKGTNAQMQNIAKKLKFTLDGSAAKISLRLTQQELDKSAEAFERGRTAAQLAATASGIRSPASNPASGLTPIPAPVKPATIRIEGLDDGPREIPFSDAQH